MADDKAETKAPEPKAPEDALTILARKFVAAEEQVKKEVKTFAEVNRALMAARKVRDDVANEMRQHCNADVPMRDVPVDKRVVHVRESNVYVDPVT